MAGRRYWLLWMLCAILLLSFCSCGEEIETPVEDTPQVSEAQAEGSQVGETQVHRLEEKGYTSNTSTGDTKEDPSTEDEKKAGGEEEKSSSVSSDTAKEGEGEASEKTENRSSAEEGKVSETASLTYWLPYWNMETVYEELDQLGSSVDTICFFAAYFDKNNQVFVPDETRQAVEKLRGEGKLQNRTSYLTFVNDKLLEQGSSLKDTDLVYALIKKPADADRHVQEIIALTRSLGCDGVEIDYERLRRDEKLWKYFLAFEQKLWDACNAEGLKLRIVLEPSAPIEKFDWPEGPEYVMMCYNLYGDDTEPGPKADMAFLKEMVQMMELLPGKINLALANGGFDFAADGSTRQINYCDVMALQAQYGGEAVRDQGSADMVYQYSDDAGSRHEVWYADSVTLESWMNTIRGLGHERFSVWRLGGNL